MNHETNQTLTIAINFKFTIGRAELERVLRDLHVLSSETKQPVALKAGAVIGSQGPEWEPVRMAYTLKETAKVQGLSYQIVYRLLQRGLLRSYLSVRRKVIAKKEIERFLKETSQSIF